MELIDSYYNHPSIVMWVIFNEGWGQYDTERLTNWATEYDTTRLINPASGWLDLGVGHVQDMHKYPGPGMPETEEARVAVLGEFGGQALAVEDHLWVTDLAKAPSHFNTSKTPEALRKEYLGLIKELEPLIEQGLAAAVYTQTTDVESEVNGLDDLRPGRSEDRRRYAASGARAVVPGSVGMRLIASLRTIYPGQRNIEGRPVVFVRGLEGDVAVVLPGNEAGDVGA